MKVYGIGGLGVDERIFSALDLHFEMTPLKWISARTEESLTSYATRFAEQIDRTTPFAIIGISFGGMLTLELNKILAPDKIILISSATHKKDIPWLFRFAGKSGILNFIPDKLLKPPTYLTNYFFGVTESIYKEILKQILADTDTHFLRWAMNQIVKWKNEDEPENLTRIHGTADRILKCNDSEKVIYVPKAGHFMIMDRSIEISQILNEMIPKPASAS